MARVFANLALLGTLLAPVPGAAASMCTFLDADGVITVTNVPTRAGCRPIRMPRSRAIGGVYRITLNGRRSPPVFLRRPPSTYDEHIQVAAEKYALAPPLLKAVMAAESNFDPRAVSEKGATGLMQLMPQTAREMFVLDIFDPAQNIDGGARYLRQLADRYGGDLHLVLAAYNAGPEAVRRSRGSVPNIPETRTYVDRVMALYEGYMRGR